MVVVTVAPLVPSLAVAEDFEVTQTSCYGDSVLSIYQAPS